MQKGQNFNHPQKGSSIRVEPIKRMKDIRLIKKLLGDKPRDYALFTLGVNTNLRASDLLQIKVGQVRHLKPMEEFEVKERKTGKTRRITLNKTCVEAIHKLLESKDFSDGSPLFQGRINRPLTVPSVNRLVKQWTGAINLRGNYGCHSLRKTFGFHQRVTFNVGIPELMVCFNHSTQRQTLTYICVQPKEIKSVYANEI